MTEPLASIVLASFSLAALIITAAAALRAWHAWLEVKRMELGSSKGGLTPAGERIELADLRERVRKLEAIASCVDL